MLMKYFLMMLILVIFSSPSKGESVDVRRKRSGTADQELFHLLEKMKHRPVAGIIDINSGKRKPWDNYSRSQWKLKTQKDEWPLSDQIYSY